MLDLFIRWFTGNPVDAMFVFGSIAFITGTVRSLRNPATRVPRIHSATTALILTCYLVAYWHLGTYIAIATGAVSAALWWCLFFRRYVGMDDKKPRGPAPCALCADAGLAACSDPSFHSRLSNR